MGEQSKVPNEADLKKLKESLARIQESRVEAPQDAAPKNGMALGMRMASEFASAILIGGLFGYGFDYWLRTIPVGLIIGLGLGFAAGTMNIMRVAKFHNKNIDVGVDLPAQNDEV